VSADVGKVTDGRGVAVLWDRFKPDRRKALYGFIAAALIFVIGDQVEPGFASGSGVKTVLVVASFVALVAAGQTFVILIGGIDLSVPWVLNGAAVLLAVTAAGSNSRAAWAIPLTLAMGLVIGLVNGLGVAFLAVPAVIMTLGMNGVMQGLTLGFTGGFTCGSCSSAAPGVVHTAVFGSVLGIPAVLIILFGVAVVVTLVLSYTTFGRQVYGIGNNERASYLSGVNVKMVTVLLYGLSGLLAATAGILLMGYGGKATLGMGDPYLFESIAAAVIGGVYILGGRGHYLGSLAGAIILTAIISLALAKNMPDYGRSIVYGAVILVILLIYGRAERET
jgi:ribose transport system permease protein